MNRIKNLIKERGITINELSKIIGVNRVTLSAQINGNANISTYERIAKALQVPIWQLFVTKEEVIENLNICTVKCPKCGDEIKVLVKIEYANINNK